MLCSGLVFILGVHDHPASDGTCRESLDMAYQSVANEVMKTPIVKDSIIVMVASKQLLAYYLLKSLSNMFVDLPRSGERMQIIKDMKNS